MNGKGGSLPPAVPHLSHAEIAALWSKWRGGDVVPCPRDGRGMALAVDGAAKVYRLVCVKCGLASQWFGTTPTGLVFRSAPATLTGNDPREE